MKIGILGGTFDPPHMGHILLAKHACEACGLDKLLLMPAANPPHKKRITPGHHRLHMARLVAEEYGFELCDLEYKKQTPSYTFETMQYMNEKYPEDKLYFIIGSDSMLDFEKWYRWKELVKMCGFIVGVRKEGDFEKVSRVAEEKKQRFGAEIYVMKYPPLEVSSTEIRSGNGEEDIPPCIRDYIKANKLYLKE